MSTRTKNGATSDLTAILKRTDMLHGVSDQTIDRIAAIARPQTIEEGEVLYAVGDPARSAYVVAEGRLRFTLGGDGRPAAKGSIIAAGDILGWAALLADQPPRLATAAAPQAGPGGP